jgi:hypothetical protein
MPIVKQFIRILMGWGRLSVQDFWEFAGNVCQNMAGNDKFPNPPVDPVLLKREVARLISLSAEATYGDSRVFVARDQLRGEIHFKLRQLGNYVEDLANGAEDMNAGMVIVRLSGFEAMPSSRSPHKELYARISRVDHRRMGELIVRYPSAGRQALQYRIRFGQKGTSDPDSWPIRVFPNAKGGALFDNLTPGVIYVFQLQIYGASGMTDWSPPVEKMCT